MTGVQNVLLRKLEIPKGNELHFFFQMFKDLDKDQYDDELKAIHQNVLPYRSKLNTMNDKP